MDIWDRLMDPITLKQRTWLWHDSHFVPRTYGDIIADARHVAAGLRAQGVAPGDVVANVITNSPDTMAGVFGTLIAGATVASLPIIARGMTIPNYVAQLGRLCRHVGATCLLAEERFLAFMDDEMDLGAKPIGYRSLVETPAIGDVSPASLDDVVFIQFSSGTTGEPRGVALTGTAIDAHMDALARHIEVDPERDIGYTWLPLSHDMGFFGCGVLSWYTGMAGAIATPDRFVGSPRTWFDDCAAFNATVTAGPPFALDMAARTETRRTDGPPLSVRLCMVGAEHIPWETLTRAYNTFGPRGLEMSALTPAYGLSEAVSAVTVGQLGVEPSFITVDGDELADGVVTTVDGDHPAARRLVSLEQPLPGVDVHTVGPRNEIVVRSPALAEGYFGDAQRTKERFRDDGFHTQDVGFMLDGELYVTGRSDDLIIVAGRNVYTQELEDEMSEHPELRRGNCAIVDTMSVGRRGIVIVAEVGAETFDAKKLARHLGHNAMERCGLPINEVVLLPSGMFPKTPSGKVQRYRCRQMATDATVGSRVMLR
jgi:fatty-acyl-CoA synthase